jgi:hypothetical protein
MTLRQIRVGSLNNIHQYDDGDFTKSIEVEDPIKCTAPPVASDDVVRLIDMGILYPITVADINNPTELASIVGSNGILVLAYKVVAATGLNEYTLYTYDASGPALNIPYVVDAAGAGDERWIAVGGKYNIFGIVNTPQIANTVLSGPIIGAPANPTFRLLVVADIPTLPGTKIELAELGSATYDDLQDFVNSFGSAGRKTGGTISDATGGFIAITAGTGFIKATNDDNAQLMFFDWPAPANIAIPANSTRYIGVEYNAGVPRVIARTTFNWDLDTEFPLGRVISEDINGAQVLYIYNSPWWVTDSITNISEVIRSLGLIRRDESIGGLILSVTGTRNVAVTSGTIWSGLNEFNFAGLDTSISGTFEYYWYKAGTGWQRSDETQYSVTQWNDVSLAALQAIDANKYCNIWVYGELDATTPKVALIYPQAQYNTAAAAEAKSTPDNLPTHIKDVGKLLGRIIIKQGVAAPVATQTVFTNTFTSSVVTDHGNLSGLSDDDHTQYVLVDGSRLFTVPGLSNNDLLQWDDPSSEWLPKSIAEIVAGQDIAPGTVTIGTVEDWRYAASIADDGTKSLPTIKANYAAIGNIVISSSGVIDESAEFEINSTGNCQIIRGSANVIVNADTDTKLCLGTAAGQNPLTIKNRLGGVKNIMITLMYVKA